MTQASLSQAMGGSAFQGRRQGVPRSAEPGFQRSYLRVPQGPPSPNPGQPGYQFPSQAIMQSRATVTGGLHNPEGSEAPGPQASMAPQSGPFMSPQHSQLQHVMYGG